MLILSTLIVVVTESLILIFSNRQHFTFMLPCRLSAASYIPFISVRMKIIH